MKRKIKTTNNKESTLLYSNNLWLLGEGLLGPLYAIFAKDIGGNLLDISWGWAIYLMVAGVMTMIIGWLTDSWLSKEKTMVAGFVVNAIASFSFLRVSEPSHLFIVQAMFGLALALATPTWYALYAKHENRRHDTMAWGAAKGEALMLTGVAMIAGGYIVKIFGFDTLFLAMGIIQTFAVFLAIRIFRK